MSKASPPRHLTDDEPIGSHAQRGAHELAHAHRAGAFGVGRSGLEPHDVRLVEPQLGGLLDRDDPLDRDRSRCASAFAHVVLPALGRARHHDVPPRAHDRFEQPDRRGIEPEVGERDRTRREPANGEARAVGRERRQHRVEARTVGEAGVDHRRRAIEAQPERRDHPLGDAHDRVGVDLALDRLDAAGALDEHAVRDRSP